MCQAGITIIHRRRLLHSLGLTTLLPFAGTAKEATEATAKKMIHLITMLVTSFKYYDGLKQEVAAIFEIRKERHC